MTGNGEAAKQILQNEKIQNAFNNSTKQILKSDQVCKFLFFITI
jgi:hypothetical protein